MTEHKSTFADPTIPDGYMKDPQGRLVELSAMTEIDLFRDEVVRKIVEEARELNRAIAAFRRHSFEEIENFIEVSAKKYKVKMRGSAGKGNVRLTTFDGTLRVERSIGDFITFDERLVVAKELVDQCIKDWTSNIPPEARALIDGAFEVDKAGKINTGRVLSLRKYNFEDKRWKRAMEAIADSVTVLKSKAYIRVSERTGEGNGYKPIALDVASA